MRRVTSTWAWTYFVQSQSQPHLVKIGTTTSTPIDRLSNLQTGSPVPLKLLWAFKGIQLMEPFLHIVFKEFWTHGEWFKPAPKLGALVKALRTDKVDTVDVAAFDKYFAEILPGHDATIEARKCIEFAWASAYVDYPWLKTDKAPEVEMLTRKKEEPWELPQDVKDYYSNLFFV